ncbi:MAG TPA: pilus assembly protein TadG-related protein [Gemmatimonadota bacterium]|nr:pilus assembly protein TadG-related protein [Gemmatimonadota bacterium]
MKPIRSGHVFKLGDERGATVVFVSLAIAAMLSIVALAVDVGMLYTARSEAQRAADAAALAGASAGFLDSPGDEQLARTVAAQIGGENTVQDQPVVIDPDEDVVVDLVNERVTVTVRRTAARGNPVLTWFANVFGVGQADVDAVATAEAALATAAVCVKPFTVPDAWADVDWDGVYDGGEVYDPPNTGYGSGYRNGMRNKIDMGPEWWNDLDPAGTTYVKDFGRPMSVKDGNPNDATVPSWYFPWDVPQQQGAPITGADRYRWNIANCNTNPVFIGQQYQVENGNMKGPTRQGVEDLVALDPDAEWDVDADSVVGSAYQPWKASPRVVTIPLYDPTSPVKPGKKPIVFNNLTSFFIHGMQGDYVVGRFLFASGIILSGPGPGPGGGGNQAKTVHLVQ